MNNAKHFIRVRVASTAIFWGILLFLSSQPVLAGTVSHGTLAYGGLTRTYRLYVPSDLPSRSPLPLVLILHGGLGTGDQVASKTNFDSLAQKEGFLAAYPDAMNRHWNDGRKDPQATFAHAKVDDVGFISALIDALSIQFPVDARRVYATGVSNGGMMCHRLAFQLTNRLAAIGPVVASIPADLASSKIPDIPIPAIIFNGTADPLVPWKGGNVVRDRGKVISVADTVAFWVKHNGCNSTPLKTQMPDISKEDGTHVWCDTYVNALNKPTVVFYGIQDGGHNWPGADATYGFLNRGRLNRDIDATQLIWAFFKTHPK